MSFAQHVESRLDHIKGYKLYLYTSNPFHLNTSILNFVNLREPSLPQHQRAVIIDDDILA